MSGKDIEIATPDGTCRAGLFAPRGETTDAGVILYMDAFGVRPALDAMAERLSRDGYWVLVPDLYHRQGDYPVYDGRTAFANEESATKIRGMMAATTQAMTQQDTAFFIEALTQAGATGPIGTTGYCMGGARALNGAAAHPGRIAAAASFHGGRLATDAPDSPHRNVGSIKARVYVGCAGVDQSFPPEQSAILAEALRTAEVDHIIENYVGMAHGWAVPDNNAHDPRGAERHWERLTTLYRETLRGRA